VPDATVQLVVGLLLMRGVLFFSRGVGKDVLRNFFSTENILQQQVEAEMKKDESRDCNQDQKKGMGREDYSRMGRFFGRRLYSSCGVFPLSVMALGVFSGRGRREGVK
jgi:hypothetical protein